MFSNYSLKDLKKKYLPKLFDETMEDYRITRREISGGNLWLISERIPRIPSEFTKEWKNSSKVTSRHFPLKIFRKKTSTSVC